MLDIKILGSGCTNCKRLEQMARKAVENPGLEAEFEKVTDSDEITKQPLISTPGLIINGKVVSSRSIPGEIEVIDWFKLA